MRNKQIREELNREVESMLPENMVAEIKAKDVTVEKGVNKNISVIHEKSRHSIIPIIASCVASVIICLAIFLPIALKSKEEYSNWVASQQAEQQIEEEEQK